MLRVGTRVVSLDPPAHLGPAATIGQASQARVRVDRYWMADAFEHWSIAQAVAVSERQCSVDVVLLREGADQFRFALVRNCRSVDGAGTRAVALHEMSGDQLVRPQELCERPHHQIKSTGNKDDPMALTLVVADTIESGREDGALQILGKRAVMPQAKV